MANYDDIFNASAQEGTEDKSFVSFNKEEWAAQKKQERESAFAMIDETAQRMANDGGLFQSYLDVQARFDRYSVGNAVLITAQKADATQLSDFKGWKNNGVFIKKGESGIVLLEPGEEYTKEDGTVGVSYNSKKVFDISQTTAKAKDRPAMKRDERLLLKAIIHNAPCPIEISQKLPENINAVYRPDDKKIYVRPGLEAGDIFRGISQELAHAHLDSGAYKRSDHAFTAYCVSYVLCSRYNVPKDIAAFVSSDGVEESFDQAGLYNFFYSIAYWLKEEGFDTAKAKVEGLLPQISEGGSGDDVSVAVMVSKEDAIAKPRQTLEQIYERVTACENVLNQVKNLLADTNDRLSEKDKESTSLEKEIAKLKAELEEKESAHKKTIAEQEALQRSVDELDAKAQRAAEQMDKASKYKASAERYWFAEFEKIGLKYQPPVEAVEVNYLQDDAENQKEAAEDSSNVVDDSSTYIDASESTVIATGERNPIDQIEHIDDTALATQPEPDYPGAYNDVKREPTQEQPLVEVKEKTAKHFWPFSKQSR